MNRLKKGEVKNNMVWDMNRILIEGNKDNHSRQFTALPTHLSPICLPLPHWLLHRRGFSNHYFELIKHRHQALDSAAGGAWRHGRIRR